MRSFYSLVFVFTLASRAFALNIVLGGTLGNITASQLLTIPDGPLKTACEPTCGRAIVAIETCGDSDDVCLCHTQSTALILSCEQCMFNELISTNQPNPNPKAGSAAILSAYAAACKASMNITIPVADITLTLPANWDGPQSLPLSIASTVGVVLAGGILGGGGLYILSQI
jgi:hypothetical protein